MNGILIINKPQDFTSFDVIAVMRKISSQRKIGHCGTLDPNATGVLPLLFGNATKAQDIIPDHTKQYSAGFKFGLTSDTLDIWGNVIKKQTPNITKSDITNILDRFRGEISQIPPMYSAVQINGQRLYDLARKGIEVKRESRKVNVFTLELVEFDESTQQGVLKVKCSKGTYIRTLIDDISKALGSCAVMTSLVRTYACGYTLDNAISLQQAKALAQNNKLKDVLLSTESLFYSYESITVTDSQAKRFSNGGALDIARTGIKDNAVNNEIYRVKDRSGSFLGLGIVDFFSTQSAQYDKHLANIKDAKNTKHTDKKFFEEENNNHNAIDDQLKQTENHEINNITAELKIYKLFPAT